MADTLRTWPGLAEGRLFTKYSDQLWTYDPNRSDPIMYRDKEYLSASAALDDYINDYEGKGMSDRDLKQRTNKYEKEIDTLLMSPATLNMYGQGQGSEGRWIAEKAESERLTSIRMMVDQAYEQLLQAKGNSRQYNTETGEILDDGLWLVLL